MAKKTIIIEDKDRYSRLRKLEGWDQETLQKARVMVVGCGALGNEVLKNLALIGIGEIFIVDFDNVELSNLTRAILFREADVGKLKVHVAAKAIKEINPEIRVFPFNADITYEVGSGVFRRMDVIIGCLDNREARLFVNRHCFRVNVPWVDGGLMASLGQLRVFIPDHGPCYECTLTEKDFKTINEKYSCTHIKQRYIPPGSMPTGTAIASIIGAMQVQEAIKIIHNIQVKGGEGLTYNSMNRMFFPLKFKYRKGCLAHEQYHPLIELIDNSETLTVGNLLNKASGEVGKDPVIFLDRDITTSIRCIQCKKEEVRIQACRALKAGDLLCPECKSPLFIERTHILGPDTNLKNKSIKELDLPPLSIIGARKDNKFCYFEVKGDEPEVFSLDKSIPELN